MKPTPAPTPRMPTLLLFPLLLALTGPPTAGAESGSLPGEKLTVKDCVLTIIDEAQIPARDAGVLTAIETDQGKPESFVPLKEGMSVSEGWVLARVDDEDILAERRVAQLQLELARQDELQKDLRRTQLARSGDEAEARQAQLDYQIARETTRLREAQLDVFERQLARRRIVAPIDGEVMEIYRHLGEWVQPGEAILHVVRMDRFRVLGYVNAEDLAPGRLVGRQVTITVFLPQGRTETIESRVSFASLLVGASGEYRMWAEVENVREEGQWQMWPGLPAEMSIR